MRATSQSVRFATTNRQERAVETRAKPVSEEEGDNSRRTGHSSNRDTRTKAPKQRLALPSFGAMLPVRLMGALYTLRAGSIARFELTRDLKGDQWRMWRGTIRPADEAGSNGNRSFVEVPAGAVGFVIVTMLPETDETDSHLAEGDQRKNEFADQELAELITSADPARIRAALPRMNPELRQVAQIALKEIEEAEK